MAKVVIRHTSAKLFDSFDAAAAQVVWLATFCPPKRPAPQVTEVVEMDGGFRYYSYVLPDVEIPVEDLETRRASNSLPMLFENQTFVVLP